MRNLVITIHHLKNILTCNRLLINIFPDLMSRLSAKVYHVKLRIFDEILISVPRITKIYSFRCIRNKIFSF